MKPGDLVRSRTKKLRAYRNNSYLIENNPQVIGHFEPSDVGIILELTSALANCRVLLPTGLTGWVSLAHLEMVNETR